MSDRIAAIKNLTEIQGDYYNKTSAWVYVEQPLQKDNALYFSMHDVIDVDLTVNASVGNRLNVLNHLITHFFIIPDVKPDMTENFQDILENGEFVHVLNYLHTDNGEHRFVTELASTYPVLNSENIPTLGQPLGNADDIYALGYKSINSTGWDVESYNEWNAWTLLKLKDQLVIGHNGKDIAKIDMAGEERNLFFCVVYQMGEDVNNEVGDSFPTLHLQPGFPDGWETNGMSAIETFSELGITELPEWYIRLPNTVQAPVVSLVDGLANVGLTPTVTSSAFLSEDVEDTHAASFWEVYDGNGALIHSSGRDSINLTSYIIPSGVLEDGNNTYSVRLKHEGQIVGESEFSDMMSFTTIPEQIVLQPSITSPANMSTLVSLEPLLTSSAFAVSPESTDTHLASVWEVYDSTNTLIHTSNRTTTALTSYTIPIGILQDGETAYSVRVQHEGNALGLSPFSEFISFSTVSEQIVLQPSITSPADGAMDIELDVIITSSVFTVSPESTDTHVASYWEVFDELNNTIHVSGRNTDSLTSYIIPAGILEEGENLYSVRVKYEGDVLGESSFSGFISFTTIQEQIVFQPTGISPTVGETGVGLTPTLQSSAFSTDAGNGVHVASFWEVYNSSNVLIHTSNRDTTNLTSYTMTSGVLAEGEIAYTYRVKHEGSVLGESMFSSPVGFTTIEQQVVLPPSITSPANGATNIALEPTLTSSVFAVSAESTDSHVASYWEVYNSSNTLIHSSGRKTVDLTSHTIPSGILSDGNNSYTVRVKHEGQNLGESVYSASSGFTTIPAQTVLKPSITTPNNNETSVSLEMTIMSSAFETSTGSSDTHAASIWELHEVNVGLTHSSGRTTIDLTSYTVPSGVLKYNTQYALRMRHDGQNLGESEWSNGITITTAEKVLGDYNVYSGGSHDNKIIKISSSNSLVWSYTYTTEFNQHVRSTKVDANGAVYSSHSDGTVRKLYRFTGNLNWVVNNSGAQGIDVDLLGNVYTTSSAAGSPVRKLNSSGSQIWSFTGHTDPTYNVSVDRDGNIYTCSDDQTVRKLDSNGNQLWSFTGHSDGVRDVAVDGDGFIYSTSYSGGTIIKIDSDGNEVWSLGGFDRPESLALDLNGNVYVCVTNTLRKLNNDGVQIWSFDSGGGVVHSVAVDKDDMVYVGLTSDVLKIDWDGEIIWTSTRHSSNSVRGLAVDPGVIGAGFWDL